jgi:hypothetical protein
MASAKRNRYFVCIDNEGYSVSLESRKIYQVIPDSSAEKFGMIRVVDESGEDYLYPAERFVAISLSSEVQHALKLAA